jgi:hypothetical protein
MVMKDTMRTNFKRIHKTRMGIARGCRNFADQIAIRMAIRNHVATIANVASASKSAEAGLG